MSGLSEPSETNENRRKSIETLGVDTTNGGRPSKCTHLSINFRLIVFASAHSRIHTYLAGQKESGDANGTTVRRALNRVSHGHSPEISDAKATFAPETSDADTSKWRMGASGKCPPAVGAWPVSLTGSS